MNKFDLDPEKEREFLAYAKSVVVMGAQGEALQQAIQRRGGITTEELLKRAKAAAAQHDISANSGKQVS